MHRWRAARCRPAHALSSGARCARRGLRGMQGERVDYPEAGGIRGSEPVQQKRHMLGRPSAGGSGASSLRDQRRQALSGPVFAGLPGSSVRRAGQAGGRWRRPAAYRPPDEPRPPWRRPRYSSGSRGAAGAFADGIKRQYRGDSPAYREHGQRTPHHYMLRRHSRQGRGSALLPLAVARNAARIQRRCSRVYKRWRKWRPSSA